MGLLTYKKIEKIVLGNLPFVICIIFFWLLYSYISIVKHDHYQTLIWDTGFFDQLLWKLSRFKDPISSFSGLQAFGDHFQLVLLFFVPIYWLPYSIQLLFIAQAGIAVFSSIPLYLLSLRILKDKLLSLAVCVSFLMFVPLQFAILDGFHQSVFSVLFYTLAMYAVFLKRNKLYWLAIFGLVITKEEMALLASAIGFVAFMKGEKLKGITTIVLSLSAFFFIVYLLIPSIQGYYAHFGYGELGDTPLQVATNSFKNPSLFAKNLIQPTVKLETVIQSLASFGFLPLLSPTLLIPAVQQFVVRFLDSVTIHRWLSVNHYSFPIAAIMVIATIFSIKRLMQKFHPKTGLVILYILIFALSQDYIYHGPINSVLKRDFYKKKDWMKNNDEIVKYLPKDSSVASTPNFGPHISQRDEFYTVGQEQDTMYLLFDLDDNPNKYDPNDYQATLNIFDSKIENGDYIIYKNVGKAYLLKKR